MIYRPTVHYAYHPCDDAVLSIHELSGRNWHMQASERLIRGRDNHRSDELGVLLMGHSKGAYWYGSRLSIKEARALAPYNNATSLQVVAGVLAGMAWVLENPCAGVVEPDTLDHEAILEGGLALPGEVAGVYTGLDLLSLTAGGSSAKKWMSGTRGNSRIYG